MAHKMLDGVVVEGNHEKLISKSTFLNVNGILDQNAHGYSLHHENDAIPLKRFTRCEECDKPLTGYLMRRKNIYYYKCKTKGCCNNKNANALNKLFSEILDSFNLDVDADVEQLIKQQSVATFNQLYKGEEDTYVLLVKEHSALVKKIDRLEERYIEEEINGDLYNKFFEKYRVEREDLERRILSASKKSSNLEKCVDITIQIASKIASSWHSSDYSTKQQIQSLVFPDGISYSKKKEEVRTKRINFAFAYVAYLQQNITQKKRGIPGLNLNYASFADLVARTGIEPVTFGL